MIKVVLILSSVEKMFPGLFLEKENQIIVTCYAIIVATKQIFVILNPHVKTVLKPQDNYVYHVVE